MPHRCTKCGATFQDGDSVILTGCPECKWNKFLYVSPEVAKSDERKKWPDPFASRDSSVLSETPSGRSESFSSRASVSEDDDPFLSQQNPENGSLDDVFKNIDTALESGELRSPETSPRVESIRIIDQGSYEVNLDSVLKKDEIVVGFKEEGQYAIDLPAILKQSGKKSKKKK